MCRKIIGITLTSLAVGLTLGAILLHYLYRPVTSGVLYLKHASGEAEILREV